MAQTKLTPIQGATEVLNGTALQALASDGNKLSAAISNDGSGEHWPYCMIEVNLNTQSSRSAGAHVAIYILPTIDGTNYSYGGDSVDPSPSTLAATLAFPADTTACRAVVYGVQLPPTDFKILLENKTGVAFSNDTNNSCKIAQYTVESV